MGVRGLQWQTLNIPLGAGLNQKGDARSSDPPTLDICTDAQFDEIGGLQTRPPFGVSGANILGGGTLADCRKLTACGDELLCFTKDELYSWSPERSAWVVKGTHLATKIDEVPRFVSTGDQTECDRAELNGTMVYAWCDAGRIYAAAVDKSSGAVLVAPTDVTAAGHVRLVALSTKILFFTGASGTGWYVRAIDPASPEAGIVAGATEVINVATAGYYFDVTRVPGADTAAFVNDDLVGDYVVGLITSALAITTVAKARACSGPITLAVTPSATRIQIIRRKNADDIVGDLLNAATLADVTINQAIGPSSMTGYTDAQITIAYSSTSIGGGIYRCYGWFGAQDNTDPTGQTLYAFHIDSDGSAVALSNFFTGGPIGLGSKAFDHDGSVYVYLTFAGVSGFGAGAATAAQLQNTLFLYRSDGHRVARALVNQAAGFLQPGYLPAVASTDTDAYSFCATERRIIPLGTDYDGYADRGPRDVTVTFDTNEARRCVLLGKTLYVSGGEIRQYDGSGLYDVGFGYFPYSFDAATAGAGGALSAGSYGYKFTYRWQNARGETERSTTATIGTVTTAASDKVGLTLIGTLLVTNKTVRPVAIEVWRTAVNPTSDAPYFLATSNDPSVAYPTENSYLANSASVSPCASDFTDNMADTVLTTKETNPENGGILECLAPPPATVIAASQDRIFLANVPNDPDRVWYSRLRGNGEIASFHDALTFAVPSAGGAITAMAFLNETLIVFRERAIYAFTGDGFANDGSGNNYGPARTLSVDCGAVNAESVATIDQGLILKSSKGWYVLTRGWSLEYIGAPIVAYDDETPLAAIVMPSKHQVRILTANRTLVWDYLVNQWSNWTASAGTDAVLWDGSYLYLAEDQIYEETTSDQIDYGMEIETPWIKLDGVQGFGRVRRVLVLGEYLSSCALRVRIARDYQATAADTWDYFDDQYWTVTPTTVGGPIQLRIGPSQQQCQAIKIRITVYRQTGTDGSGNPIYGAPNGEALKLSGLALEIGVKRGPYPMLPSTQKI